MGENIKSRFFPKNPMTVVWLLFVLCLTLTLRIWVLAKNTAEENDQILFSLYTDQVSSLLQERINSYEQFLRDQGALWDSNLFVAKDWRNYIANTDLFSRFPGIEAIGFSEIRQPLAAPIRFLAPETPSNNALLGKDLLTQIQNPPTQLSGALLRTTFSEQSFVILIPLAKQAVHIPDHKNLGLIFGWFSIPDIIKEATENKLFQTALRIYDTDYTMAITTARLIYQTPHFNATPQANKSRVILNVLDRLWVIEFSFPIELSVQARIVNTLIWISGILFSFIIFGINKSIVDYHRLSLLKREHEALKADEFRLKYEASHDLLTDLYNRQALKSRFSEALRYAHKNNRQIAIAFIDIDNLKDINDKLGHNAGDEVLKKFARRLTQNMRSMDTAARVGGDEFILILSHLKNDAETVTLIQRILHSIEKPISLNGIPFQTSCSIGLSVYPRDGDTLDTLTKQADRAMYESKKIGKNSFTFYQKNS
jgi:diguanylate cyclase (GGDEF)-like protein